MKSGMERLDQRIAKASDSCFLQSLRKHNMPCAICSLRYACNLAGVTSVLARKTATAIVRSKFRIKAF